MAAGSSNDNVFSRRHFVSATTLTAASWKRVVGANERIQAAIVGSGNRGRRLLRAAGRLPDVEVIAVCDLYQGNLKKGLELASARAEAYGDYRRVLDRKDIDAVIIATHNHWHHRIAVDALQSGRDIYLEKPMTHKLEEGPDIIRAAEENKRIVQVGHHRRSSPVYQKARELVEQGWLGKITFIRVAWFRNSVEPQWRRPIPPDASPETIDWETFIKPTKKRPFDPARFFQWFCYCDYSGGIATDLLVHSMDAVHMVMGAQGPERVIADGEILYWKDGREVPDTFSALFHYPEGFQVNFSCTFANQQPGTRDEFYGKEGTIIIADERRLYFYPEPEQITKKSRPELMASDLALNPVDRTDLHVENFFKCVRSRKQPHCTVYDGENSAVCAHLANMSMLERRFIRWDPKNHRLV